MRIYWIKMSYDLLWEKVCMPLAQKTAQILVTKKDALKNIKWTDGESNTDSGFSTLACESCKEAWEHIKDVFPEYKDLYLKLETPDINISFSKGSEIITKGKIELKSSKGKGVIPGSTIGSLDINEPVIFCLRNESGETFDFRYHQYHSCIGETDRDMFQDRTPRPRVNFHKMMDIARSVEYNQKETGDWVEHYAKCALVRIKTQSKSWQDDLVTKIVNLFIKETSIEDFIKMKSTIPD